MITLLMWVVVLGVVWYLVDHYIPMHPAMKSLFTILMIVVVIYLIFSVVGVPNVPALHTR